MRGDKLPDQLRHCDQCGRNVVVMVDHRGVMRGMVCGHPAARGPR